MAQVQTFWGVWCPEMGPMRVTHDTLVVATDEAKRLAVLNPGKRFFIMQSDSYAVAPVPMPLVVTLSGRN